MSQEQDSLSQNWRINQSSVETAEYVEVLRSLQRMLTYHNPDGVVMLKNKSGQYADRDDNTMVINPRPLLDAHTYPLDPHSFDVMAGSVLRRSAKKETKSDAVINAARNYGAVVHTVAKIGEAQVLQNYYAGKQRKYVDSTIGYYRTKLPAFEPSNSPVADALKAYVRLAIDNSPVSGLDDKATENLLYLIEQMDGIEKLDANQRVDRYQNVAHELMRRMTEDEMKQQRQQSVNQPRGQRGSGSKAQSRFSYVRAEQSAQDKTQEALAADKEAIDQLDSEDSDDGAITEQMQEVLNEAMAQEMQDVSQLLAQLAGKSSGYDPKRNPTIAQNYSGAQMRKPDEQLLDALQWLKNIKNMRDMKRVKELPSGKVDIRRLYKAPFTNQVFRETYRKPRQRQNIWLVMDGSGSMRGEPGNSLFSMCASVKAIVDDARIYQYYNGDSKVHIKRMDAPHGMYYMNADGSTPSGEALLYTGYLISKEKRKGLLIHFTDGDSNSGMLVDAAMEKIEKEYPNVTLLNVIMGDSDAYNSYDSKKIRSIRITKSQEFAGILKAEIGKLWGIGL